MYAGRWYVGTPTLLERLLEVRNDVVDVLESDGDPDQPRRDRNTCALLFGELRVGGRCRVGDDRPAVTEIAGVGRELERVQEAPRAAQIIEVENDDAAAPRHLSTGECVLGMALEERVANAPPASVSIEMAGDTERAGDVALHAHAERLQRLREEPRIERGERRTRLTREESDVGDVVRRADHDTAHRSALAVDVFRRRVDDEIGAV